MAGCILLNLLSGARFETCAKHDRSEPRADVSAGGAEAISVLDWPSTLDPRNRLRSARPLQSLLLGQGIGVGPVVLAPAFRAKFTAWLDEFGVPYIRVGEVVFIRFLDWLSDPDDWVINASNKSVNALVNPLFLGAALDFKQPPPRVRDLIAESEREHGYLNLTCELVHAVAIEGW
jgi:hypothetical protein